MKRLEYIVKPQENGRKIPAIMWMHNPLPELRLVEENPEECKFEGHKGERCCCSVMNTGLFMACLQRGDVKGIFVGHDHINDWCGIYKGVYLSYSLPHSYNLYNLGTNMGFPEEKWHMGVTVTKIHADGSLDISPRYNNIYL